MERIHDGDVAIDGDHTHMHVSDVHEPALDRSNDDLVQLCVARRPAKRHVNEKVDEHDGQQHVADRHTRRQGIGFDTEARRDPDSIQRQDVAEEHHAHDDKTD